jgi:hypothetical protein
VWCGGVWWCGGGANGAKINVLVVAVNVPDALFIIGFYKFYKF